MLSEGGAVRGEIIGVPDNGIHLGHVSMTTDERRFPTDSDSLVARSSVREIHVERLQGNRRTVRVVAGALGGLFLVPGMVAES